MRRAALHLGGAVVAVVGTLVFPGLALADTTVDFEQQEAGTVITNQYADLGGPGQGVVFGPLPGSAGDGLRPVIRTPPAGQAQSGSQVADIATCFCENFMLTPRTTGTFSVPRSRVSVYVGYLGPPAFCSPVMPGAACAYVTLRAFDASGNPVATSSTLVKQGQGVHALLSVSTPSATIVGFEITARHSADDNKQIAIDDLSFDVPSTPPPPDFTLTPQSTVPTLVDGAYTNDVITIGRLSGSAGDIRLAASGLPPGVHARFAPNPATSQSTLTLTADPNAPPTGAAASAITITGTALSATAGTVPHSFTVNLRVESVCADVVTGQELIDAIRSGCKTIHLNDAASIDVAQLAGHPDRFPGYAQVSTPTAALHIPYGVTLESDRSATHLGAQLSMSYEIDQPNSGIPKAMLELDGHTRVTGLRLKGGGMDGQHDPQGTGISIQWPDVLVDDNEISFWPGQGVGVGAVNYGTFGQIPNRSEAWALQQAPRVHITNNFIHDNVDNSIGYGIVVGTDSYALIDRNVFDYNKHDIAGTNLSGYIATLNFTLSDAFRIENGSIGGHFDMHGSRGSDHVGGTAGTYIEIRNNTFRGDQSYHFLGHDRRAAFDLRGTPIDKAIFTGNVTEASASNAVNVSGADAFAMTRRGKLVVRGNRYSVNSSGDLAVGDFDGDGCSDVFLATGTSWVYSACGRREWRYLNASNLRLNRLAFGDFNGDGKTDVFSQSGAKWLVSYGGTGPWTALPADSNIPMSSYRFYDFNGDGRTDIFRANGSHFYYSSAGASSWKPLATSHLKVDQLRFCDFNGDGKTDVFSLANHQWSVSYGGATHWHHLNKQLSSDLGELVFADFNGDGRCDIARAHHNSWQISYGGTAPWHYDSPNKNPGDFTGTLLGRFNGNKCADVLRFGIQNDTVHLERFKISRCLTPFAGWSRQNML
jgi:hypothetical protein